MRVLVGMFWVLFRLWLGLRRLRLALRLRDWMMRLRLNVARVSVLCSLLLLILESTLRRLLRVRLLRGAGRIGPLMLIRRLLVGSCTLLMLFVLSRVVGMVIVSMFDVADLFLVEPVRVRGSLWGSGNRLLGVVR